jgi:iron complex transport system substrate-binding protein
MFFSEVLGAETKVRAENYCSYLNDITQRIRKITSGISEKERPRVYYGKVTDFCSTQGRNTIMKWYTELAGGVYLPGELQKYFASVNMEKIISWDPDIIMLGMYGSFEAPELPSGASSLRACKTGKLYKVPAGIFYWDMTSCETALLPLYLGKLFHPRLFRNWDIVKEMKEFYSRIYGITISDSDAGRILKGLPPL